MAPLRSYECQASELVKYRMLSVELDGDLRWNFFDGSLNFIGGVGQPVGIDIDSYAASATGHVPARFQLADRLFELVPAFRTLKFDDVSVNVAHRKVPSSENSADGVASPNAVVRP
jgi:hypothetical protein